MKKVGKISILFAVIAILSGAAYAESIFTPLNFEDTVYMSSTSESKIAVETSALEKTSAQSTLSKETIGGKSMQTAISELDNAQVEVRNELLNYKTKYSEVDAKYNTIKTERNNLAKQMRACEKKIRQLDNAKEKIRKNMVTQ